MIVILTNEIQNCVTEPRALIPVVTVVYHAQDTIGQNTSNQIHFIMESIDSAYYNK